MSTTSHIVLGLVQSIQPATPYELKALAQASVMHFWTLPHTQLYTECARLAEAGLLAEDRELDGRRRRRYSLTETGALALETWRREPSQEIYQVRDPGLLQLFFGGDAASLAGSQLAVHEAELGELERMYEEIPEMPRGMQLALEAGIALERTYVDFWRGLAEAG